MTFAQVDAFLMKLPGVTVGARWNNKTWSVGQGKKAKALAWERPFSKADLKRFGDARIPQGEILAIATDGLDAKDALLSLAGFFTIPHFDGFAAVLVELKKARAADVKGAIESVYSGQT